MSLNNKNKIKVKCCVCNNEWDAFRGNILRGSGCLKCFLKLIKTKTNKKYIEDIKKIHYDRIISIEEYLGDKIKINHQCCKCNFIWKVTPNSILRGIGCPKCSYSKGELECIRILDLYNIKWVSTGEKYSFVFNNCIGIKKRRLFPDFYLPDINTVIEYNGIQHYEFGHFHSSLEEWNNSKINDQIKKDFCIKNNIKFIEIKYNENIEEVLKKRKYYKGKVC